MCAQLGVALDTIVLWWSEEFQWGPHFLMMPRDASLSGSYKSDWCYISRQSLSQIWVCIQFIIISNENNLWISLSSLIFIATVRLNVHWTIQMENNIPGEWRCICLYLYTQRNIFWIFDLLNRAIFGL